MLRRPLVIIAAVAALGGLAACSESTPPPFETSAEAFTRLTSSKSASMPADVDEPGTYTIAFDRYALSTASAANEDHVRVGVGAHKRRTVLPEHLVRTVTRPFDERIRGRATRSLGFVDDQPNSKPRVVLLRPLPNDPRPRVYPLDQQDQRGDARKIASRACRVWADSSGSYCIDDAGLVLASDDGQTVDIATRVTTKATSQDAAALTAQLAKGFNDTSAGSLRPIAPTSSPPGQTDFALTTPPEGFTFVGRYAVVALSSALLQRTSRKVAAGIVDVYVRGKDAIMVDRGGRLDTSDVADEDLGGIEHEQSVDLGALGTARAGIGGIGPFGYREVRFAPSKGRYVAVTGTVPLEQLIAVARSLTASPGNQLVYTDNLSPH